MDLLWDTFENFEALHHYSLETGAVFLKILHLSGIMLELVFRNWTLNKILDKLLFIAFDAGSI